MGGLVLLGTYLPWVWVGPLFLRGVQGDGKLYAIAGLVTIGSVLAYLWNPHARKYAWLSCLGGLLAWFVAGVNFLSIMTRTLMDTSVSLIQLSSGTIALGEGVSRVASGSLTLPGDLFFLALTHQERVPALMAGLEDMNASGQEMRVALSSMDSIPHVGGGLILSLVVGGLLFLFGCGILFRALKKSAGLKAEG